MNNRLHIAPCVQPSTYNRSLEVKRQGWTVEQFDAWLRGEQIEFASSSAGIKTPGLSLIAPWIFSSVLGLQVYSEPSLFESLLCEYPRYVHAIARNELRSVDCRSHMRYS